MDKFGKAQVEMIKDSNDVNRASLDLANKVGYTARQKRYVRVYIEKKKKYRSVFIVHRLAQRSPKRKQRYAHTHTKNAR